MALLIIALFSAAMPLFSQEAYQIPQTVYVGDRALLVLPLEEGALANWEKTTGLPSLPQLHIHRITAAKGQISIDFTAFSTGFIEVPAFEIPGLGTISGLKVSIASIFDGASTSTILSPPAAPLPVPGTSALVSGIIAGAIILSFVFVLSSAWRKRWCNLILKRLLHYYLIFKMNRFLSKMHKTAALCDAQNGLCRLHNEVRRFMSRITGIDCLCLTVSEIEPVLGADFAALINRCDTLRFAGVEVTATDFCVLLDAVQGYVNTLSVSDGSGRRAA
ncbi:MAG: hypothetical protein LBB43_06830 [Spirochaetaceae bacterium]|nr:hypothetical protein [Spirochaetaceae bacterium]